MLAYVFWHRPAPGVEAEDYERALARFHHSLAHRPPEGFRGSAALRAPELPWLGGPGAGPAYEDWYLLEGWDAVGVLESAAVARGHHDPHHEAARRSGEGTGSVYRLLEGSGSPLHSRLAVWVTRPPGKPESTVANLLEDGMDPAGSALWRRCLTLGPAPELCLLSSDPELPPETGLAETRLPAGWSAQSFAREPVPVG
jgi:hypothetical protein